MSAKTSTPPQAYTRETLTKAFEWMKSQPESIKDKIVSADSLVRFYLHSKRFGSPTLALLDDRQPNLEDLISVENFKQDLKDLAQGLKQFEEPADPQVPFQARPVELSASVTTSPTFASSSYKTSAAVSEPRPSTKSVDSGRVQEQNYGYSSRIAEQTASPIATAQPPPTTQPYAGPIQQPVSQQYSAPNQQTPSQQYATSSQYATSQQYAAPTQQHTNPQQNYQPSHAHASKEGPMNYSHQAPPSQSWNNSMPSQDPSMGPTLTLAWDEKTFMAVKAVKERFNLSSDQEALRMLVATGFDRLREGFLKGF